MPARTHDPDAVQMSFGEHLEELRRRIIFSLVGVVVVMIFTSYYARDLIVWLCQPLIEVERGAGLPEGLYTTSVLAGFTVWMKVGLVAALIIASPWVVYQIWKFIEAGLYAGERYLVKLMLLASGVLTCLSVIFFYYFMLPATLAFLILFSTTYPSPAAPHDSWLRRITKTFMRVNVDTSSLSFNLARNRAAATAPATQPGNPGPTFVQRLSDDPPSPAEGQIWINTSDEQIKTFVGGIVHSLSSTTGSLMTPLIGINEYLNLVLGLAVIVALSFQIPVVMGLIGGTGLVDPKTLARYRKYVFFGVFVLGIFITPSQDIFSDVALPLMMYALFELGLVLMRILYKSPDAGEGPMKEGQ